MDKLRLRFEKTGRAVWISHLDLMSTMQRAFSRAGYELQYSEGFNPHPLISILLPLSVGMGSICELMDFRLRTDVDLAQLPARLTAALPEGIRVLEAYPSERKSAQLKWLEVEGRMEYDNGTPEPAQLAAFFARDSIIIEKKTKRGIGQSDIRPAIRDISFSWKNEEELRVHAIISAQEPTLNPELLVSALRQLSPTFAPDFARFTRLETYNADLLLYR